MGQERAWRILLLIALGIVGALLCVLAVTGIWLTFRYRPTATYAFTTASPHRSSGPLRTAHRVAAVLFLPATLVVLVASLGLFAKRLRRSIPAVFFPLGAVAAGLSGYLLPWDQLALRSVTVGTNIAGYRDILSNRIRVKYIIVGSQEIARSTLVRSFGSTPCLCRSCL